MGPEFQSRGPGGWGNEEGTYSSSWALILGMGACLGLTECDGMVELSAADTSFFKTRCYPRGWADVASLLLWRIPDGGPWIDWRLPILDTIPTAYSGLYYGEARWEKDSMTTVPICLRKVNSKRTGLARVRLAAEAAAADAGRPRQLVGSLLFVAATGLVRQRQRRL